VHPVLFEIGSFAVGTYALFALLGLVAGLWVSSWLASRDGLDRLQFVETGLWGFVVAIVTAKVFGVLTHLDTEDPVEAAREVLRYGGHFYAGFLGGVAFVVILFHRRGIEGLRGLDHLAPGLALAHALGRVGCFMAGCCWGKACDLPWAVTFTSERARDLIGVPLHVPLHPTQLYEAVAELVIGGVLVWAALRRPSFRGRQFLVYVVLYGGVRFVLEAFRDDPRGTFLGLPTSQAIAAVVVPPAALAWIVLARRHAATSRPAEGAA
jgi:phosphatidylglycerol:prolipoprotein diacylglycerol transferase